MIFTRKYIKDILVEHVLLSRATKEHAEEFKKILLNDIEQNNTKLIADLEECEFIDSTFISSLVTALKAMNKKNGTLKIVAAYSEVISILELTGMVKLFEVYKTKEEATASFKTTKTLSE